MAKTKQLTVQDVLEQVNNLTTKEQEEVLHFIEKTLQAKADAAKAELLLIQDSQKGLE